MPLQNCLDVGLHKCRKWSVWFGGTGRSPELRFHLKNNCWFAHPEKKKKHVLGKEFHYSLLRFIIQREFEHVVFSPTGFQTTNQWTTLLTQWYHTYESTYQSKDWKNISTMTSTLGLVISPLWKSYLGLAKGRPTRSDNVCHGMWYYTCLQTCFPQCTRFPVVSPFGMSEDWNSLPLMRVESPDEMPVFVAG